MVDGTSCALRANLAPRTVYARGLHMLGGSLYELRYLKKKKNSDAILEFCWDRTLTTPLQHSAPHSSLQSGICRAIRNLLLSGSQTHFRSLWKTLERFRGLF